MKIKIILISILFLFVCIAFSACTSCQFAPDREDFDSELAFMLADCNYRNHNSPLACVELAKRYNDRDSGKEQREILSFCKDSENYPSGWDNEKCRMFLKQR